MGHILHFFTANDIIPPGETTLTPGVSLGPKPASSTGDDNYPSTGQNTQQKPALSTELYVSGDKPTTQQPRTTDTPGTESDKPASTTVDDVSTTDAHVNEGTTPTRSEHHTLVSTSGDDVRTTQQYRSTDAQVSEGVRSTSFEHPAPVSITGDDEKTTRTARTTERDDIESTKLNSSMRPDGDDDVGTTQQSRTTEGEDNGSSESDTPNSSQNHDGLDGVSNGQQG